MWGSKSNFRHFKIIKYYICGIRQGISTGEGSKRGQAQKGAEEGAVEPSKR